MKGLSVDSPFNIILSSPNTVVTNSLKGGCGRPFSQPVTSMCLDIAALF